MCGNCFMRQYGEPGQEGPHQGNPSTFSKPLPRHTQLLGWSRECPAPGGCPCPQPLSCAEYSTKHAKGLWKSEPSKAPGHQRPSVAGDAPYPAGAKKVGADTCTASPWGLSGLHLGARPQRAVPGAPSPTPTPPTYTHLSPRSPRISETA